MATYRHKDLSPLSEQGLALLGVTQIAYIRPVDMNVRGDQKVDINQLLQGYAICAADGTQLAVLPSWDAAFYTARQHDLEPLCVH